MNARSRFGPALALILLCLVSACTPRLSLPFRDYEAPAADADALRRAEAALRDAGWEIAQASVDNTLRTERRTLSRWGLYRVTAYVEVVPLGGDFVRVFFHPYREYVTGGRSKIPYLVRRMNTKLVRPLEESLKEQGLYQPGSRPEEKNEIELQ